MERISRAVSKTIGGAAILALSFLSAGTVFAHPSKTPHQSHQTIHGPTVAGKIIWGAWIDDDGCMHWWADGGVEGYMLDRVNPKTGKPVCLKRNTCLVENTDQLFATDSLAADRSGPAAARGFLPLGRGLWLCHLWPYRQPRFG